MFTPSPPGTRVRMVYQNQDGDTSARTVDVIRWSHASNGFTYLRAWCHLRSEERTFRADRIIAWEPNQGRAAPPPFTAEPPRAATESPRAAQPPYPWPKQRARAAAATPQARAGYSGSEVFQSLIRVVGFGLFAALVLSAICTHADREQSPSRSSAVAFTAATGIADRGVERLYESADSNHDGGISIAEIQAFQSTLYRRYAYRKNETALRPDQFLAAGGGDCDDWALAAAGMLRYWGYTPWLVCYGDGSGAGHAMCFLQVPSAPRGADCFMIDTPAQLPHAMLPAGYYVPIDYDDVGSLSNAVGPGWTIQDAWIPEQAYGLYM